MGETETVVTGSSAVADIALSLPAPAVVGVDKATYLSRQRKTRQSHRIPESEA